MLNKIFENGGMKKVNLDNCLRCVFVGGEQIFRNKVLIFGDSFTMLMQYQKKKNKDAYYLYLQQLTNFSKQ